MRSLPGLSISPLILARRFAESERCMLEAAESLVSVVDVTDCCEIFPPAFASLLKVEKFGSSIVGPNDTLLRAVGAALVDGTCSVDEDEISAPFASASRANAAAARRGEERTPGDDRPLLSLMVTRPTTAC